MVIDLGMSPLGASGRRTEHVDTMEPFYPLQVWVCDACWLVQLPRLGNGESIISEYASPSSASPSRLEHARRYVARAIEEFRLTPNHRVVEVGSNDGYLLQYFVAQGIPVLGIDVAVNVARAALARGVPTRITSLDRGTARALCEEGVAADLVVVNNVLTDVHDLSDFVAALKLLMAPRGVMTMEFPHLLRLIADNQFDTIRHGRFSYFSLLAATRVLASNGLTIYDVDELDTHGGSLRIFACHSEDPLRPIGHRVNTLMAREREAGVDTLDYYAQFAGRVREAKQQLVDFLVGARRDGKHVAGYGAYGKTNTLLSYCGIDRDFVEYAVDPDPQKHGRCLPGSHIPIRSPELIEQTRPDFVLLLRSQLQNEMLPQFDYIRAWGGRCVIPIPELHMVA